MSVAFFTGTGAGPFEEPMSRFFCAHEITKPEDVIPYLAKQGRHWKQVVT